MNEKYNKLLQFLQTHPKARWFLFLGIIVYLFSPIDFWPEIWFGPLGLIDDGTILSLLVSTWLTLRKLNRERRLNKTFG